jgi:excisionase family DNA binding protein
MPSIEAQAPKPIIYVGVEFYRGTGEIARFLGIHERTVRRLLHNGKLPAKKDGIGTWVSDEF